MKETLHSKIDIPGLLAGVAYGGAMFMAGFAMGTIRQGILVPIVGETLAVLMEIPFMLVICWALSKHCLTSYYLSKCLLLWRDEYTDVDTIGITSFITLLMLETFLSITVFHASLNDVQEGFSTTNGRLGLCAQLLAASFPIIQLPRQDDDNIW